MKGVIFDFGRVICDFDFGRFFARASQFSSLPPDELALAVTRTAPVAGRYETGLISSREFYREISRLTSLSMPEEEFRRAYNDIFTPIPGTIALIQRLTGNYRLGLLSNTNEWHYESAIRTIGIFPLFDAVTVSHKVHAMKPDARIYADMLGKLALPAQECVYIDDIAEYVAAGRALGLHAIQYTTHERLMRDLTKAGVVIPPD